MKEIKVIGIGTKSYPVDEIRINITNQVKHIEYDQALELEKESTAFIKDHLDEKVSTTQFRVDPLYEGREVDGSYQQIFVGYQVTHQLLTIIELDYEKLGQVINILSKTPNKPSFHLDYTTNKFDHDELLELAIKDAKRNGQVIADAAQVELKEIKSIHFLNQPVYEERMMKFADTQQIEFENVQKSKSVEVTWII